MENIIRRGLRSLDLPEDAAGPMAQYGALLLNRNQVMNLTAITSPEDVAALHFLDSAAILKVLDFSGKEVIDVGSGAGFPGLPLRLLEPSLRLTMLDAQRKRVDFLRETCSLLGLESVSCVHARAEEFGREEGRERYSIAVSRAVAGLPMLAELCLPLVKTGGWFLAMKSVNCDEEIHDSRRAVSLLGGCLEQVRDYTIPGIDVVHRAVVIRKERSTPKAYPRTFSKIKKKPL